MTWRSGCQASCEHQGISGSITQGQGTCLVKHCTIADRGVCAQKLKVVATARGGQCGRGQVTRKADGASGCGVGQHHTGVGFDFTTERGAIAVHQSQCLQWRDQAHRAGHIQHACCSGIQGERLAIGSRAFYCSAQSQCSAAVRQPHMVCQCHGCACIAQADRACAAGADVACHVDMARRGGGQTTGEAQRIRGRITQGQGTCVVEHGVGGHSRIGTEQLQVERAARGCEQWRSQVASKGHIARRAGVAQHHTGVGFDFACEGGAMAVRQGQSFEWCVQAHSARHAHRTRAARIERERLSVRGRALHCATDRQRSTTGGE